MGADTNSQTLVQRHTLSPDAEKNYNFEFTDDDHQHEADLQKLKEIGAKTPILPSQIGTDLSFKHKLVWSNMIGFIILHLFALYGTVITFQNVPSYKTTMYSTLLMYLSGFGVTMGAHRLWSHRAYKAKLPLRVVLMLLHTLAGQNCLYVWVRDHRQHHKFSDTDADPHNAVRGFFFSHIGWLMSRKHPKVIEYGRKIDMSDLEADRMIMFQKKYYKTFYMLFSLLLPTSVPIIFWNEDPVVALFTCFFARTVVMLNATWCVNSLAHAYGTRPYDKNIKPVESMFVAFFSVGEGWHNYHHAYPWDYRASELGTPLNVSGFLIDILANFGLAYDRKEATHNMIKHRVNKTGDTSHWSYGTPTGRRAVETLFNIWNHPANPTYNSIYRPKDNVYFSGHSHSHNDVEPAANEVVFSEKTTEEPTESTPSTPLNKYFTEKADGLMEKLTKLIALEDTLEGGAECNNNRSAKDKSELNMNVDDVMMVKM